MTTNKPTSIFALSLLPEFLRDSNLGTFLKYYFEFLDQTNNINYIARKLTQERDSDLTDYFTLLRHEFMDNIPSNLAVREDLLIKHIVDFYQAKGSEEGVRIFFRILFNEEIDFYIPGDDILRVDDGRYDRRQYLKVSPATANTAAALASAAYIIGATSGATASVVDTESLVNNYRPELRVFLRSISGTFKSGEVLKSVSNTSLATTTSTLLEGTARYVGTYGFLDSDKRLQDDFYWQEFSYVIKTLKSQSKFGKALDKLTHPSGTKMFSQVLVVDRALNITQTLTENFGFGGVSGGGGGGYYLFESSAAFPSEVMSYEVPWYGMGVVSVTTDQTINGHKTETILSDNNILIGKFGTNYVLSGAANVHFTFQLTTGSQVTISSPNTTYTVAKVYNDKYAELTTAASTFSNQNYYVSL